MRCSSTDWMDVRKLLTNFFANSIEFLVAEAD